MRGLVFQKNYTIDYKFELGADRVVVLRGMYYTERWAAKYGLDATDGWRDFMATDSNGDGRVNLMDFAFGGNPAAEVSTDYGIRAAIQGASPIDQHLTMTLPIWEGAEFSGTEVRPTLTADDIVYVINGDIDLSAPHELQIEEVVPAIVEGLPVLDPDFKYRTFRITTPVSSLERAFMHASVQVLDQSSSIKYRHIGCPKSGLQQGGYSGAEAFHSMVNVGLYLGASAKMPMGAS